MELFKLPSMKNLFKGAKAANKPKAQTGVKEGDKYTPATYSAYYDASTIRSSGDTETILKNLQKYDADSSNAIWSVLRFADTELDIYFVDDKGVFDADKTQQFIATLDSTWLGTVGAPNPRELSVNIMQQLFMFGGLGMEVILDEFKLPTRFVTIAAKEIKWRKKNGVFLPFQEAQGKEIKLDIPTFFYANTDLHPDQAISDSPLLSAIQAVTFKQTVINDIQRVIRRAGYPRHRVKILEDILIKNAPGDIRHDPEKLEKWVIKQKKDISDGLSKLNPEDAIVVFDSVEIDYLSTQGSMTVDFRPIVEVLDSQLTSSLKVLPSILGKGSGSQNIASVETMVFINTPTFLQNRADKMLSQAYTLSARLMGLKGTIRVKHRPINLRPELELEPQKLAKQNRILQLQSFGHITDSEAAIELGINHLPENDLSGTLFLDSGPSTDTANISPNADPLGRSISGGDGAGDTRGNSSSS